MNPRNISSLLTRLLVIAIAAQFASVGLTAQSQRARERASDNARSNREGNRPARTDEQFIRDAYERGVLETKLAQAAVQNSQDKDIQTIGHRIINEQGRAMQDLEKLATSKSIALTKDLASADQTTYEKLAKLQGAEFDRAYRDHLQAEYKRTIEMYQDTAQQATDSGVRDVASRYASLFEEHAQTIGITGLDNRAASTDRSRVRETDRARSSGPLSQKDQQFLNRVHRMSRTEMEAARLAAKNSRDRQVQSLAQRILTDHKQMEQELKDLTEARNFTLPKQLGEGQQSLIDKLEKLSGNEFDKEYNQYLVESHKNSLALFEEGARSSDPDVQRFASKQRDAIREHLRSAQQTGDGTNR